MNNNLHIYSDEDLKTIQAIDDVDDPAKIAEMKAVFQEQNPFGPDAAAEGNTEDGNAPAEGDTTGGGGASAAAEGQEPEIPMPKAEEKPAAKIVVIDDGFIANADPADLQYLRGVRGEKFTEKALKNYLNSQRLIAKYKSAEQRQDAPPAQAERSKTQDPQPAVATESEAGKAKADDIAAIKQQQVISALREKFPHLEIPETLAEYRQFKADLNYSDPDSYYDLKQAEKEAGAVIDNEVGQLMYFRDNYKAVNQQKINLAIARIESAAEEMDIDLNALGVNLKLDEAGTNDVIADLIFLNEAGDVDPAIVQVGRKGTLLEGIPVVNESALADKFLRSHFKTLIQRTREAARKEGFTAAINKRNEIPITGQEHGGGKPLKASLPGIEELDSLTPEQVQALKTKMRGG